MKKFFSLVLALVMALSLTTVAWGAEKLVSNAAELISTIATVQDGDVIKLTGNVTFDTTDRSFNSGSYYDGVLYTGGASFTINLGGFTITSDGTAVNDYLLNFQNMTSAANTITIKNGILTAVPSVYSALCVGSSAATAPTTVNTENLTLNGVNPDGAVMKVRGGSTWNANAGTIVNANGAYTALECSAATANINAGAKLSQTNSSASPSVGSAIGVSYGGTVNVNGAEIISDRYGAYAYPTGGTVNINSGTVTAPLALYADEYPAGSAYNIADAVINVSGGTITGDVDFGGSAGDATITISGGTVDGDILANTGDDLTVSGGTFPNADVSAYLPSNLTQTTDGVVVSEGGAVLGTKYDMVTTDIAQTKTTGVTVNTYSAKSPKDTNKDGKLDQVGNVQYVEFSNMPGRYFVQVATVGKADYTVYHTGTKSVFGYFAEVVSPFYLGNGVAFYDFGENCGQYDDTPTVGAKYYLFQGVLYVADATELSDVNLKVGSDMVSVIELPDEWVGHVPAFTYDKDYKIVGVKCAECGTPAVIYPNYDSVPKAEKKAENVYGPINTIEYYCWLAGPVADTDTDKDDKVTSAETFDAGIAMYVGMSVMAAAGAVVLKKRED